MKNPAGRICIRRAALDDAPAIASVLYHAFVEHESSYTPEAFLATTLTRKRIQERIRGWPVWVALQGEAIIGTVSVIPTGETLYIKSMAVLPEARGRRIGESFLKHIETYARENGHTRLALSTTPFLLRAIRLYESCGFRRTDEGPHDLFGTPLFTMEKILL